MCFSCNEKPAVNIVQQPINQNNTGLQLGVKNRAAPLYGTPIIKKK